MPKRPVTGPARKLLTKLEQLFPEPDFHVSANVLHKSLLGASYQEKGAKDLSVDFVLYTANFEVVTIIELDDSNIKSKVERTTEQDAQLQSAGYRIERIGPYWQNLSDESLKAQLFTGKKVALQKQKRATSSTGSIGSIRGANPRPVPLYALAALALVLLAVQIPWNDVPDLSEHPTMRPDHTVESKPAKLSERTNIVGDTTTVSPRAASVTRLWERDRPRLSASLDCTDYPSWADELWVMDAFSDEDMHARLTALFTEASEKGCIRP